MNPYAAWSNPHIRRASPSVPSVHGVLPFAPDPSASNNFVLYFTAFNPSILNCTVIGKNTFQYFSISTDAAMPEYTAVKNSGGSTIGLIEWKDQPLVELQNVFSKQRYGLVASLARCKVCALRRDARTAHNIIYSHRSMNVLGEKYIWTPRDGTICVRVPGPFIASRGFVGVVGGGARLVMVRR